jgi:hypothetical protein
LIKPLLLSSGGDPGSGDGEDDELAHGRDDVELGWFS